MTTVRRAALAPLVLLLALTGCADILGGGGDAFHRRKLAESRALWETRAVPSYRFDLDLVCACVPAGADRTVRITVEGDSSTVRFISSSATEQPGTPPAVYQSYASVEKLFTAVEDAISRDQDVLQVGYDREYGFPDRLNGIFSGGEQIAFAVSNFQAPAP